MKESEELLKKFKISQQSDSVHNSLFDLCGFLSYNKESIHLWNFMSKKEKPPLLPSRNLTDFAIGDEIYNLGLSHRTEDCNFEVLDPEVGALRSLMTGDDTIVDSGYFIKLADKNRLPSTADLKNALKGEFFNNLLDGKTYQVVNAEDDHLVRLLEIDSGQVSLNARTANNYFYKINKDDTGRPPIDNDGQFLLFEL
jgi:hypothetical protein